MNANKRSLGQLFDPSIRLVVPLFQRPYVWEQEHNWEPLWESLHDLAERRLDGMMRRPHFLGAVVLDQLKTRTCAIDARQVIDGQQRLTTFQLVLAAARDLCRSVGDERFVKAFAKLTGNDIPLSEEPDDVFKVWPTNVDRAAFRAVMTASSCAEVCKQFNGKPNARHVGPHHRLANAYLFFYRMLDAWLGPTEEPGFAERLRALWQALKDDMQVVVIDLDEDDDAQVNFETLNALGTPLLPADLIKNFLFQSAAARNDNTDDLYRRYWKPFDERGEFWRAVVGQGRLKRPRLDQFLQHYLKLVTGDEVPATHLFAEFRDYARRHPALSAADHQRSLHGYAAIFERFYTGYDRSSREGQFFYRLGELETTTFFPLLLEVFKAANDQAPQEVQSVLVDLESFLVRRMVCGLTTKTYNTLIRSQIQKLRADRFSARAIREFLLGQEAESTRWPSDAEFRAAWVSRPVYELLTRGRVRVVLEALELALHTGKSERVTIESQLTIEHIMPQQWHEHWPRPQGASPEEAEQRRDRLIHTFGNLTLLTSKLNPSMSNSSWETKRKALPQYGALSLNRQLCGLEAWDEAAIEPRAGEMFDLAKKIWPKP
jgi:hypothetical protein